MIDNYIEKNTFYFIIGTIIFVICSIVTLESGTNETLSSMTVTACRLATVIVGVISISFVIIQLKASATTANADFIYKLNTEFLKNNDIHKIYQKLLESYTYETAIAIKDDEICRNKPYGNDEQYSINTSDANPNITDTEQGNSNKENQFNDNDKVSIGIYLIFFETLYYFYKRGLITIDDINDLFAQRFFIAVHNPDVQKYLIKNCIFYKNVFKLYDEWIKLRDDNGQFVLGDEKYKLSNGKFVAYRLYSKELESRYGEYSYDRLLEPDWRDILNPKNMNTPPNEGNQKIDDAIKEPKIQL